MVGFAGIPEAAFDFFRRAEATLLEPGDEAIAETCKNSDARYMANEHAGFFLKRFAEALATDHHNALSNTGFVVLYVNSHAGSAAFADRLFPGVLTMPVTWRLEGHNRTTIGRSFGLLRGLLRVGVQQARRAVPVIKKEVTEHDGRTPFLLPIANFHSRHLVPALREAERDAIAGNGMTGLTAVRRRFEHVHPPQRIDRKARDCFVDDRGTEFHPPGSARHAFARDLFAGHPPDCLVNGRRRLGSPYDRAFHYDCQRDGRLLSGEFPNCHGPHETKSKLDNLNIAPNDNLRG